MIKWKLLLTTLPFVAASLAVKLVLDLVFHVEPVVEFSDIGVVLTGAVFLIGFMLSGTMSDYKESEKLPGDLACALEGLEDDLLQACAAKPDLDAAKMRAAARALAAAVREWLLKRQTQAATFDAITAVHDVIFAAERAGASSHAARAMSELQAVRKAVTRIGVISRTSFLQSGYALLDTLVVLSVAMLMVAKFKSQIAEMIVVPFVTLIFVYMVRLIRDVDDPFEYSPDGKRGGAAEVELLPLDDLDARWRR